MSFNIGQALHKAEEFVRRHIKSKAVVEAEKRRGRRQMRNGMRRLARAASVTGASGVGVVGYGLAVAPVGITGLVVVGAAAAVAAGATLFWPSRPAGRMKISTAELVALMLEAEDWLLRQRPGLPVRALPALDAIFFRLNDLHPHIVRIDPSGTLAWDLRRLLTEHLPLLIQNYCSLPATVRDRDPTLLQRLLDGMGTLDEELVRICKEASSDHLLSFEVRGRFIESRYKDGDLGAD